MRPFIKLALYPVDYADERTVLLAIDSIESVKEAVEHRLGSHSYFTSIRTKTGDEVNVTESVEMIAGFLARNGA